MARNEPGTALSHAVVLAYGPASATGAAVRHARTCVGESGTVEVVAATRASRDNLGRLRDGAVAIDAWGLTALREVTERHADALMLLIHDDVTISRRGIDTLVAAAHAHRRPAVPWTNEPGVDALIPVKRPKHPGELDQLTGSVKERLTTGSIGFSCVVATGTQLSGPIDSLIHIPGVRLSGVPAVVGQAVAHHPRRCLEQIPAASGPDGRPLLVANLIVRNETDNIEACIASLDGLVDRVEVVDTGSTDDTVALARAAGASVHEVEWRDDFGWARNQVLDRSRDAWFALWIDADERLTAKNPEYFRRILAAIAGDIEGLTLQVRNRGSDDSITSTFYANRIFSTDGTSFTGALHERVLSRDGTDLNAVEAGSVKLDHYGYADDVVDAKEKYLRNLDIAKRDYETDPNPRHAFEYARALGLGQGDPQLRVDLLSQAVHGDLDTPGRANVYAALAHAMIDAGDYESAVEAATSALELVPGDDLAGAALARAATDIGDYETVAGIAERRDQDGPRPLFEVQGNRVLIDSLVAAALIRLGRSSEAIGRLESHLTDPQSIAWATIAQAAASTTDPVASLTALAKADLSGLLVAAVAEHLPAAATAQLALARVGAGSPSQKTVSIGLLAATVAGERPLVEELLAARSALSTENAASIAARMRARGFGDLAAILDQGPSALDAVDPSALAAELTTGAGSVLDLRTDPPPIEGERFEVVVVGPLDDTTVLASIRDWIDPAGYALVWEAPSEPASLLHIGGSGPQTRTGGPSTVAHDLVAAGFRPETVGSVHRARPELDEDLLQVVMTSLEEDAKADHHDLGVITIGSASEEAVLWLRASVPGRLRLTMLAELASTREIDTVDTRGVERVLVIPAGVVSEPSWLATLLDATGPAGVGLLDANGSVLHAGATPDGATFATGTRSVGHPLLLTDRFAVPLPAPFICPSSELSPTPVGRHIGRTFARSVEAAPSGDATADLADVLEGRAVLAIEAGPSAMSPAWHAAFTQIIDSGRPHAPVVVCGTDMDDDDRATLHSQGVFVFEGPAAIAAVTVAYRPPAVYYLGTKAFDGLYGAAAGGAPGAAHIAIDYHGLQADLADAILGVDLSETELASITAPTAPSPVVAEIPAPTERLPGTVSVVIPVWNNWEYTDACLASLREHAEAPLEIVVVDNGSTDATPHELARRDGIIVVTNDENLGFPTAVNQGLSAARGEFVCILNNDTIVTAGWLTEMLKALEIPGTGMVGPRSNQISGLQTVPDSPALSDRAAAERWARRFVRGREGTHWLINRLVGFCLVARRSLFEEVGGFDQGFGIGNYEDDELSARVLATGQTLRVADASVVLHHGGATFSKLGIDYGALMAKAGRHFGGRTASPSGLLTAIVLSDGSHAGAAATAMSLLPIADRIRVVERSGFAITEFESGTLRTMGIEIINHDWQDPTGAAASLTGIEDRLLLICEAGETIDVGDWAKARVALESAPPGPIEVRGPSGFEVRIDRPEPAAIDRFGSSAEHRLNEIQIKAS